MKHFSYLLIAAACVGMLSCKSSQKPGESPTRGTANILVDETFYPMVEGQVQVFENQYKYAKLNIIVRPEQQITDLLMKDSARVAVLSRNLTASERAYFEEKKIIPRINEVASDAIALIISKNSKDTVISEDLLKLLLAGKVKQQKYTLVFDNSYSGTVQYMKNYAGVEELSNAYSLNSNVDLIKYVATNNNAIGFIGVDWLYEADSLIKPHLNKIKVLAIQTEQGCYKPTQNDIALGAYPFIRKICVVNCQGTQGLGTGFATFVAGEVGQRIILKAGLVPTTYPKREIVIRN